MSNLSENHTKSPIQPAAAAFARPDNYAKLPGDQKETEKTVSNDDFCLINGEDYYIRTVMFIPIESQKDAVNLGVWVKVDKSDFKKYHDTFDDPDAKGEFNGNLANAISLYPDSIDYSGKVILQTGGSRPLFVPSESDSEFYKDWKNGVSKKRGEEIFHSIVS